MYRIIIRKQIEEEDRNHDEMERESESFANPSVPIHWVG